MPNGHSSRPTQLKNQVGERVRGGGLKIPLINDCQQQSRNVHIEHSNKSSSQYYLIPCNNIVSSSGGYVVTDQWHDKFGLECMVVLLDDPSRMQHLICTLAINRNMLGYPPLDGLSQPQIMLHIALLN